MTSTKPETKLTLKIRAFGTPADLDDLFAKLNAMGYLSRSEDITLVCGYYVEEEGVSARDQAEALLREHPAIYKAKSTTSISTKRTISSTLPAPESEDEDDAAEEEELPLLAAIDEAIRTDPHFDDLPLAERILRLLRLAPASVADLVEALAGAPGNVAPPTEEDVQIALEELYDADRVDLDSGVWHLVNAADEPEPLQASIFDQDTEGVTVRARVVSEA